MNGVNNLMIMPEMPVNEKEIMRYAGCRTADAAVESLLLECLAEARPALTYKVVWRRLPLKISGGICDFSDITVNSPALSETLEGCEEAVLFAATVGAPLDRLIAKYSRISPAKALMMQAIGTERIEALCDAFCSQLEKTTEKALTPRFSPGYKDLDLSVQRDICALLSCEKRIGVCLNDSLLMSPSKSVTAFAGLCGDPSGPAGDKCKRCRKTDCEYRR